MGLMTDDRRRRTEDRGRMGLMTDDRRQTTEDRGQMGQMKIGQIGKKK